MPPQDRKRDPFAAIRAALASERPEGATDAARTLRLDGAREARTGTPEVVYAPGKTTTQLIDAVRGLVAANGRAIISRVGADTVDALRAAFPDPDYTVTLGAGMRTATVEASGYIPLNAGGRVGILTAGTSDVPTADEARVMAGAMGCDVRMVADVGVAGLHRLFRPLEDLFAWGADALIVAAGMDGALPSVVAGLSLVPVIGLPTPIGYGVGAGGVAALHAMLQSCAPGLVVVNIDNGIGAGVAAARIANQSAAAQRRDGSSRLDRPPTPRGE